MKHTSGNNKLLSITWKYKENEYFFESYVFDDSTRLPNQFNLKVRKCYVQALYRKRKFLNFLLGDWILIEKTEISDFKNIEFIETQTYKNAINFYGLSNPFKKIPSISIT